MYENGNFVRRKCSVTVSKGKRFSGEIRDEMADSPRDCSLALGGYRRGRPRGDGHLQAQHPRERGDRQHFFTIAVNVQAASH